MTVSCAVHLWGLATQVMAPTGPLTQSGGVDGMPSFSGESQQVGDGWWTPVGAHTPIPPDLWTGSHAAVLQTADCSLLPLPLPLPLAPLLQILSKTTPSAPDRTLYTLTCTMQVLQLFAPPLHADSMRYYGYPVGIFSTFPEPLRCANVPLPPDHICLFS